MTRRRFCLASVAVVGALAACGDGDGGFAPQAQTSRGQVGVSPHQQVSYYAAARFAEHVSFGATPALIAELRSKGFERWIDEQFALPLQPIDTAPVVGYPGTLRTLEEDRYLPTVFGGRALAASDQLRQRLVWALSQWVVAGLNKGENAGHVTWVNLLQRNAFGNYRTLLREAAVHPHMAHYLDNDQNRPKSAECPDCAPNENFARELMQLFSLGVFKLNPDGTPMRDGRGRFIETYTQRDVEEMARVLTGWEHDPDPPNRPSRNWGNWTKPMKASAWPPFRDSGAKVVLGRVFPAGQSASKDLDDAVDLVTNHPNAGPFVALRLIQHLVKSDPSPAYLGRVAAKFRDNGSGVAGDMKTTIKAVLLDPEARAGDDPVRSTAKDGKIREPVLHGTATLRGLGCQRVPKYWDGNPWQVWTQRFFDPGSVFSFYLPSDRSPGSNLLAPEQRLLSSNEFTSRLGLLNGLAWHGRLARQDLSALASAGCDVESFIKAFERGAKPFTDILSERYFRGGMPHTLRSNIEQQMLAPTWNTADRGEGPLQMIGLALATPYFGVIK